MKIHSFPITPSRYFLGTFFRWSPSKLHVYVITLRKSHKAVVGSCLTWIARDAAGVGEGLGLGCRRQYSFRTELKFNFTHARALQLDFVFLLSQRAAERAGVFKRENNLPLLRSHNTDARLNWRSTPCQLPL